MKHEQIKSKAERVVLKRKHRKPSDLSKVRATTSRYYDDVLQDPEIMMFLGSSRSNRRFTQE